MNNPVLLLLLLCLLLPAAWFDIQTRVVPNELCLAGCAAGLLVALGHGLPTLGASLLGMTLAFCLAFPLWLARWLGAGDVKLLAAVGAMAGISLLPRILLLTVSCGLLLALAAMIRRGETRATFGRLAALFQPQAVTDSGEDRFRLPYAVAIAAGSLLALLLPFHIRVPV